MFEKDPSKRPNSFHIMGKIEVKLEKLYDFHKIFS
jgi:hypothetical protein